MASRRNQSNRKRKSLQNPRSQRLNPRTLKGPQLLRLPQSRVRNSAEDTSIEYALCRTQEYNLNHVVKGKLPVVAISVRGQFVAKKDGWSQGKGNLSMSLVRAYFHISHVGIHLCNSTRSYVWKARFGGETRESYLAMHEACRKQL